MKIYLSVFVTILLFNIVYSSDGSANGPRPTVIWHGMGDTCCYPFSMGRIKKLIESEVPGIYVNSIEIGDSIEADEFNSFFKNVNEQVDEVCEKLKADPALSNGFNAIGFSQGGQFLRAYVERCNNPPVFNLVSVGGQHQGVFGLPQCLPKANVSLCNMARELVNYGVYTDLVQSNLVQAEYWQDPMKYDEYLEKSQFLADINNARSEKNETYKQNFQSLNQLVLVLFTQDTMVIPRESEWFGFYEPGTLDIIPMEKTDLYVQDWIGLQYLDQNNRIQKLSCDGNHLQFSDDWFIENLIPFLNNTVY